MVQILVSSEDEAGSGSHQGTSWESVRSVFNRGMGSGKRVGVPAKQEAETSILLSSISVR